ncbi:hypothetical protein Tsubulata_034303 [Turnera subulata]|uniref:Uncharacterized protein n=1 Tax=Turnera subulata TaxID=218843 RepID=A0A9Q0F4T7_9ROSI|nr:hypothetical protein Tsubulata_034303 [Turnera subulata]
METDIENVAFSNRGKDMEAEGGCGGSAASMVTSGGSLLEWGDEFWPEPAASATIEISGGSLLGGSPTSEGNFTSARKFIDGSLCLSERLINDACTRHYICCNKYKIGMNNGILVNLKLLGFVPGLVDILPNLVLKLQAIRNKYMAPMPPIANTEVKKEGLSFASIWNTVLCLMLISFLFKIVTATAQGFLKEQQEKELALASNSSASNLSHYKTV